MKLSRDLVDDASESAQSASKAARDTTATTEAAALGEPALSTAGEIRNDWTLKVDGPPSQTLLGVPGFPAARTSNSNLDAGALLVTPETVSAIEKVKRATDPSLKRVTDPALKLVIDDKPVDFIDGAPIIKLKSTTRPEEIIKIEAPTAEGTGKTKYEDFQDLGLAPKPATRKLQRLVVSSYRLIGFGILSLIVFVLLGYIGQTLFYFMNRTWVTPVALSPNDEKVVGLQSQLAANLNVRAELVSNLEQAERSIKAEQEFQMQFAKAVKRDAEGRKLALKTAQELSKAAAATRQEIKDTNNDYTAATVQKMENEYDAGLIDRNSMLSGKFQLAQISSANLNLTERQAEYDQRAAELAAETQALDALLADDKAMGALSYDVLKIARDYQTSKLALAKEVSDRDRLKEAIVRQDQIIAGLNQAGYLRAIGDKATVAQVPYANLDNVKKGAPLYGCKLDMLFCHEVGKVVDVLEGEVMVKQPNRDAMLRGRMVELQLSDPAAAQNEVLFAGHRPLGI